MIFITVGSQKFQFNRLLEELDRLVVEKTVNGNEIFAQIGYSTYQPRAYRYKQFLDKKEFLEMVEVSELIITHGGTGSLITSLKKGKKIIGVPRSVKFYEHVDDHQFEIVSHFMNSNLIYAVLDIKDLGNAIVKVSDLSFREYKSNTIHFIGLIEKFINNTIKSL